MTVNGNVATAGFALTVNGARDTNLNGSISGTGRLANSGAGVLTLSGANTFTGGTTLSAGTVVIGNNAAFGTGTVTVTSSTVILGTAGGSRVVGNAISLGRNLTFIGADDLRFTGAVTLTASRVLTVNGAGIVTLAGTVSQSGTRSLTKAGTGTLVLEGNNSYSGGMVLSAGTLLLGQAGAVGTGTLRLGAATLGSSAGALTLGNALTLAGNTTFGGSSALVFNGNASLTGNRTLTVATSSVALNGVISGTTTTRQLIKAGPGTLVLGGGSGNSYQGTTTVKDGTLALAKTSGNAFAGTTLVIGDSLGGADTAVVRFDRSGQIPTSTGVTMANDGQINLQTWNTTIGSLTATGGRIIGSGQLALGGNVTATTTGSDVMSISTALTLNGARTFTINNNGQAADNDFSVFGNIANGTATGSLTKQGTGTLLLSGAGTYSGGTFVNDGVLVLNSPTAGAITSGPAGTAGISLGNTSGTASASLILGPTPGLTVANAINVRSGSTGILTLGASNASGINRFSGAITLNRSLFVRVADGGTLDLDGGISGTGSLTKTDPGLLRLGAANSYTGLTTVSGGTLLWKINNALGSGAVTVSGGILDLGVAHSDTVGQLILDNGGQLTGSGGSVLSSTAAFDVRDGIVSLPLAGNVGLTKSTAGTVFLSASNTYTGATAVNAGTLLALGANTLPSNTTLTVAGGAVQDLNGFNQTAGSLAGAGTVDLGAGLLTVGGNNTSTLFSGILGGTGGLTKTGTGVLSLGGANTFTGSTGINAGTLRLGAAGVIPDTSAVSLGAGAGPVLDLNGFSETIGSMAGGGAVVLGSGTLTAGGNSTSTVFSGTLSGTGSFIKAGTGTTTLTGINSFTGTATLNAGAVTLSGASGSLTGVPQLWLNDGTTLTMDNSAGANVNRLPDTAAVNLTAATLRLVSGSNGGTETVGQLRAAGGASTVSVVHQGNPTDITALTFASVGSIANGATVNFTATGGMLGDGLGGPRVYLTGQPLGLIGGWATVGSDFADYTARGVTAFSNYYLGSDGINLNDPTEVIQLSAASPATAWTLIRAGTTTNNGLSLTDAAVVDLGTLTTNTLNLTGGGLLKSTATATAVSGNGRLTAGGTAVGTLAVSVAAGSELSIASTIINNAGPDNIYGNIDDRAVSLSKSDAGLLVLSGTNTYTGTNYLNGGTLRISASAHLGNGNNGLVFGGGALEVTGTFNAGTGRAFSVNADESGTFSIAGGQTLTLGSASNRLTTGNAVSLLTKTGAGSLVLPAANPAFDGVLRISQGTVEFQDASALGDATLRGRVTLAGGTLRLRQDAATAFANEVTVSADSTLEADRLTGTAAVTHSLGNLNIGSFTLNVNGLNNASPALAGVVLTGSAVFNATGASLTMGPVSGAGGFTKSGTGTLILQGTGTITGGTIINGGTLRLGNAAALPANSAVTVTAGGVLDFSNFSAAIGSLSGAGSTALGTGTLTTGGNGASTLFSGIVSGTGGLVKTGTGIFTLGGPNAYTGSTTVNAGTLRWGASGTLASSSALTIAGGATADMAGFSNSVASLSGAGRLALAGGSLTTGGSGASSTFAGELDGTGNLIKTGSGILTLAGPGPAFAGGILVQAGVVALDSAAATGTAAGPLSVGPGGELQLAAGLLVSAEPLVLAGTGTASGGALRLPAGTASWNGPVSLSGPAATGVSGDTLTIGGQVALGSHALTVSGTGSTLIDGAVSGSGGLVKTGSGLLALRGTNLFTGTVQVTDGVLRLDDDAALGATGPGSGTVVMAGAALRFDDPSGITVGAEPLTVSGSGGGLAGAGALQSLNGTNTWNGPVTLAAATTVRVDADSLTLDGVVGESGGPRDLTKTGAGTLVLGADNTYTGATVINGGSLLTAEDERIHNQSAVTVAAGATLDLQDYDETLGSLAGAGSVQVGTVVNGGSLLRFGENQISTLFTGVISGTGGIEKTGSGVWSVSEDNPWAGATRIYGGVMDVTGSSGRLSGTASIDISGGTLRLSGSHSDRIANTAAFTMGGAPDSRLSLSGNVTETLGSLSLTGSSVIDFGTGTGRLTFANSSGQSWSGTLSVWNWSGSANGGGTDQLRFGNNPTGLTSGQASSIELFSGPGTGSLGTGKLLPTGELVPVPEPAVLLSAGCLVLALTRHEFRRRRPAA